MKLRSLTSRLYILVLAGGTLLSSFAYVGSIDGRTVLSNMLNHDSEPAYRAHEITTISRRTKPISSEQNIWKSGLKGKRIEYLKPPTLRGNIIVDDGKELHDYVARERLVRVRPSMLARYKQREERSLVALKSGKILVKLVGRDHVAGRSAYVIEIKPNSHHADHSRRLWIDAQKWVKLKSEDINPKGQISSTSVFTSIQFMNSIPADTFKASFGRGVRVTREPAPERYSSIAVAQKRIKFRIMTPNYLPTGYSLVGVVARSYRHGKVVTLRYSDGVNSFSLFQSPGKNLDRDFIARLKKGPVRHSSDTYSWRRQDSSLTLVGNLSDSQFRKIAQSVR